MMNQFNLESIKPTHALHTPTVLTLNTHAIHTPHTWLCSQHIFDIPHIPSTLHTLGCAHNTSLTYHAFFPHPPVPQHMLYTHSLTLPCCPLYPGDGILVDDGSAHRLENLDPQKREQLEARFLGRVSY